MKTEKEILERLNSIKACLIEEKSGPELMPASNCAINQLEWVLDVWNTDEYSNTNKYNSAFGYWKNGGGSK